MPGGHHEQTVGQREDVSFDQNGIHDSAYSAEEEHERRDVSGVNGTVRTVL